TAVIARLDRATRYSRGGLMRARSYCVYILASRIGGTLYIGVTNDLARRVAEHRLKQAESFTKKYEVGRLVYFEIFDDAESAIQREKRFEKVESSLENPIH